MKKIAVIALALAGMLASTSAQTDLFSTVQDWVGTGQNEAAFEIDWNNGTANEALIWGYRFDGTATGEQMFDAIIAADPRLYAEISEPGEFGSFGTGVFGFGFHPSGDGNFQLSPSLSFNNQLAVVNSAEVDYTRTAVNAGDVWQEGFDNTGYPGQPDDGYWAYYNSTDSRLSADPSDWDYGTGMTGRTLENGDVDGWLFSFNGGQGDAVPAAPVAVAPVPEPSTWAMLGLGAAGLSFARRKWGAAKKSSRQQAL